MKSDVSTYVCIRKHTYIHTTYTRGIVFFFVFLKGADVCVRDLKLFVRPLNSSEISNFYGETLKDNKYQSMNGMIKALDLISMAIKCAQLQQLNNESNNNKNENINKNNMFTMNDNKPSLFLKAMENRLKNDNNNSSNFLQNKNKNKNENLINVNHLLKLLYELWILVCDSNCTINTFMKQLKMKEKGNIEKQKYIENLITEKVGLQLKPRKYMNDKITIKLIDRIELLVLMLKPNQICDILGMKNINELIDLLFEFSKSSLHTYAVVINGIKDKQLRIDVRNF